MADTPIKLDQVQVEGEMAGLPGWTYIQNYKGPKDEGPECDALAKTFGFPDFNAAWGFMSRSALVAEQMNHHPDWRNCYGGVKVILSTHDCSGVSALDITLARRMNELSR